MKVETTNDYELIKQVKAGNEEALDLLIVKYKRLLFHIIKGYQITHKYSQDVSELYQISLISLYNAVKNYDQQYDCSFSTYLQVVITRNLLSHYRAVNRSKNKVNVESVSFDEIINENEGLYLIDVIENPDKSHDPEYQFHKKEKRKEIDKILMQLSEEELEIFMYWAQGYAHKEIAEALSINPRRVGYLVSKIKKKLQGSIDYKNTL